jgi:hypothetical protein
MKFPFNFKWAAIGLLLTFAAGMASYSIVTLIGSLFTWHLLFTEHYWINLGKTFAKIGIVFGIIVGIIVGIKKGGAK